MPRRFTVAIPTHDRRETVLLAVRSALSQSEPPEQILVLCDECTDGTAAALRALAEDRVDVLELPKAPGFAYRHRNRSLELARGDMIMWLGDDDLLLPDHLERLSEVLRHSDADLALAPAIAVEPDDTLTWHGLDWGVPSSARRLERTNTAPMSAVCVSVEAARRVGGWDERIERGGDWDLWRRILSVGARAVATSEPTVLHFRATGREQQWSERVAQNSEWFARISDPATLAPLRLRLRAQRDVRDARWLEELDRASDRVLELSAHLAEAAGELERVGDERRELELQSATLSRRLADVDAELLRLRERDRTLERVYAGGWWRLRGRLLGLRERLEGIVGRATRARRCRR